jgi:CDP-diacylglycerol--glycerol-3-phosphate 3-phosphatidyltransferase
VNLPNTITLFRLALVPVLVVVLLSDWSHRDLIAFGIFFVCALSDMADGVLARRKKMVTVLGALLDPIADKVLISAVLICLVDLGPVPAWMAIVIIAREFILSGFRIVASSRNIHISSSILGKLKMWSQGIAIGLLLLGKPALGDWYILARISLWVMLAIVLISAGDYIIRYGSRVVREND